MFALIVKRDSRFLDGRFGEGIKTPLSGVLRGGGWGCYADAQAMRAWAAISWAVSSISVGGVSM